jgi:hypothetical protein
MVETDRPQIRIKRMRFACWITKAKIHRHTLIIFSTYCIYVATMVTRTRFNIYVSRTLYCCTERRSALWNERTSDAFWNGRLAIAVQWSLFIGMAVCRHSSDCMQTFRSYRSIQFVPHGSYVIAGVSHAGIRGNLLTSVSMSFQLCQFAKWEQASLAVIAATLRMGWVVRDSSLSTG